MNPFSVQGKVVMVTGASSGLGRSCAVLLSSLGAKVILIGRNTIRLEETLQLMDNKPSHKIFTLDITLPDQVENCVEEVFTLYGPIGAFVNFAGISQTQPIRSINKEKLENFFQTNVYSAIYFCKALSKPKYIPESGASFILISSVMGNVGEVGKTLYSLTKGALIAGVRSLALELATKKIRVNCISPGVILTPMTESQPYSGSTESLEKIVNLHPLGLGESLDIANACVYLISDAAKWITGSNLIVDGGYTAR